MGIPKHVDMATVAMVTELGHMSTQMLFSNASVNTVKDRMQGEECEKVQREVSHNTDAYVDQSLSLCFELSAPLVAQVPP